MQTSTPSLWSDGPMGQKLSIQTTLYELVQAIGEEINAGEEHLVTETVLYLLAEGRVKFVSPRRS